MEKQTVMRKYLPHIVVGILLIACIAQLVDRTNLQVAVAVEKQKVKDLEKDVTIHKSNIKILEARNVKMTNQVKSLNAEIAKSKHTTTLIQIRKNETINNVDAIPVGQLQSYFSDRVRSKINR